ncbi:PREDICTED: testis-expressed sequence 22 protein [Elephantulus edwardii]|uniref:testis-expressed sequence 22 protein n=1 Tax=Elephantulus edwardii TaxID=28737 RepID=UPI0003F08AFE|nr:PREDICTED: testis-expressed sequence 22 protein [Elephantulus edwardii]
MDSTQHRWKVSLGKKPETLCPPEHKQPLTQGAPAATWNQPSTQSGVQQGLQTQDWVCEQPELHGPGRRWSLSIEERRRLAVLGAQGKLGAGTPTGCRDITQVVSQLVSEDVDKDVLIPHPPRSAESRNAFHTFII